MALALQSIVKPKPIARARPRLNEKPEQPTHKTEASAEELRARQAKAEQGHSELVEVAMKLLKNCQDIPIDERILFGGAEGYEARVKELRPWSRMGKGKVPAASEWKTLPSAMQRNLLATWFEDAHLRAGLPPMGEPLVLTIGRAYLPAVRASSLGLSLS